MATLVAVLLCSKLFIQVLAGVHGSTHWLVTEDGRIQSQVYSDIMICESLLCTNVDRSMKVKEGYTGIGGLSTDTLSCVSTDSRTVTVTVSGSQLH